MNRVLLATFVLLLVSFTLASPLDAAEAPKPVSLSSVVLFVLVIGIMKTNFNSEDIAGGSYPIDRLGQVLLGDFLVPFEVVSVLLLAVMIGAAYLAKGRRRDSTDPTPAHAPRSNAM